MADIPSPRIAKRVALGSIDTVATNDAVTNGSTVVNLAKQALPVQGGLIGNFAGVTVVGTVTTTAITGLNGTVEIALQGSHDNAAWFNIPPCVAASSVNTFTVTGAKSGCPSGAVGQAASANFPGPLPQYIRGALRNGSTAPAADGRVVLNAIVFG